MVKRHIRIDWERALIISILILALALRLTYFMGYNPLLEDEAAIGYEAYSVLETGKDIHGEWMPFLFKSWGDYKLPVSVYASAIPYGLFGLSAKGLRALPFIMGISTVYLVYRIGSLLFDRWAGLASASLLAFSPHHIIIFSHNMEVAYLIFLTALGVERFLKGGRWAAVGALILGIGQWTIMKAPPVLFALIILLLFIRFGKGKAVVCLMAFLIFSLPIIHHIHHSPEKILKRQTDIGRYAVNPALTYARYLTHYLCPGACQSGDYHPFARLNPLVWILMLAGILFGAKHRKETIFLIFWILASGLPSALTPYEPCHEFRFVQYMLPAHLLGGLGLCFSAQKTGKKKVLAVFAICALTMPMTYPLITATSNRSQYDIMTIFYNRAGQLEDYDNVFIVNGLQYTNYFMLKQNPHEIQTGNSRYVNKHAISTGKYRVKYVFYRLPCTKSAFISHERIYPNPAIIRMHAENIAGESIYIHETRMTDKIKDACEKQALDGRKYGFRLETIREIRG